MTRYIGVRHRTKKTAAGEARPTQVCIMEVEGNKEPTVRALELETALDEMLFIKGTLPVKWRRAEIGENIATIPFYAKRQKRAVGVVYWEVATEFDGLRSGDHLALSLGGSGHAFACAATRHGVRQGFTVWLTPPINTKEQREAEKKEKDDDSLVLAKMLLNEPQKFHCSTVPGLANSDDVVALRRIEKERDREVTEALEAAPVYSAVFRKIQGCGPHIAAMIITGTLDPLRFLTEPDAAKLEVLRREETEWKGLGQFQEAVLDPAVRARINREIAEAAIEKRPPRHESDYWLLQITRDVRRAREQEELAQALEAAINCHEKRHKLRDTLTSGKHRFVRFCGLDVTSEGQFRRRGLGGDDAARNDYCRDAFNQLAEQFVRRPDSEGGQQLNAHKAKQRVEHPEETVDAKGRKRYTKGDIHTRAYWRTATRTAEKLFVTWVRWARAEESKK